MTRATNPDASSQQDDWYALVVRSSPTLFCKRLNTFCGLLLRPVSKNLSGDLLCNVPSNLPRTSTSGPTTSQNPLVSNTNGNHEYDDPQHTSPSTFKCAENLPSPLEGGIAPPSKLAHACRALSIQEQPGFTNTMYSSPHCIDTSDYNPLANLRIRGEGKTACPYQPARIPRAMSQAGHKQKLEIPVFCTREDSKRGISSTTMAVDSSCH